MTEETTQPTIQQEDEDTNRDLSWKDHVVIAFFIKLLSDIDDNHVHTKAIASFRAKNMNEFITQDNIDDFREVGHKACLSLLLISGIYLHDCLIHEKNRKDPQAEDQLNNALLESREAYNMMYNKLYDN